MTSGLFISAFRASPLRHGGGIRRLPETTYVAVNLEVCDMRLGNFSDVRQGLGLDDVGAGAARLTALVDLEPAFIKLDVSITRRLEEAKIAKLLRFVCDGACSLDARVVCEGVETSAIADLARSNGAACGQGYFFGKPGPLSRSS